jgi:ribosomal protein L30
MAKRLKVQLVKSLIKTTGTQRATARSLGLSRRMQVVEHPVSAKVLGELEKLVHLVRIEEVSG